MRAEQVRLDGGEEVSDGDAAEHRRIAVRALCASLAFCGVQAAAAVPITRADWTRTGDRTLIATSGDVFVAVTSTPGSLIQGSTQLPCGIDSGTAPAAPAAGRTDAAPLPCGPVALAGSSRIGAPDPGNAVPLPGTLPLLALGLALIALAVGWRTVSRPRGCEAPGPRRVGGRAAGPDSTVAPIRASTSADSTARSSCTACSAR